MRLFVTTLLLAFTVVSSADADLLLDLKFTDGTSSKTVSSGDTVFVDLILSDPDGGILAPGVTLAGEGLGTGGGLITQTSGGLTVTSTSVTAGSEFDSNPLAISSPIAPGGGIVDSVFVTSPILLVPPFVVPAGIGMSAITIATFELVATGMAGDFAVLAADVLEPNGAGIGNETFANFENLDALLGSLAAPNAGASFGSVTLSIAAVPEPSTILTGILIAGGLVWRRRKTASA